VVAKPEACAVLALKIAVNRLIRPRRNLCLVFIWGVHIATEVVELPAPIFSVKKL
jgi:hypothetical protein